MKRSKVERRAFEPPVPGRNRRAARALWEALSPRQRAQMRRTQSFSIRGSEGGRYQCEFHRDRVYVRELKWRKAAYNWCWSYLRKPGGYVQHRWALVSHRIPRADDALAAKLMLESRESHFVWLAQRSCGSLFWLRSFVGRTPTGSPIYTIGKNVEEKKRAPELFGAGERAGQGGETSQGSEQIAHASE